MTEPFKSAFDHSHYCYLFISPNLHHFCHGNVFNYLLLVSDAYKCPIAHAVKGFKLMRRIQCSGREDTGIIDHFLGMQCVVLVN